MSDYLVDRYQDAWDNRFDELDYENWEESKMSEYTVECQALIELKIQAESKEEAEEIAGVRIIEKCLYDADSIDWSISAYEENGGNK